MRDSIESVLNQTYTNIELIVVDDGSTDDSVHIIKEYKSELTLLEQDNNGVSAARNLGINAANGELICLLDADDVWLSNKVRDQVEHFLNPNCGLVYSSVIVCDEQLSKIDYLSAEYRGDCRSLHFRFPTRSVVTLGCSTAMFRKKLFESVGGFDTKLNTSADWDFFRRIANLSHLEFIPQATVYYRRHKNNMSLQPLKMYYADNEIAITKLFTDEEYPQNSLTKPFMLLYVWARFQLGAASAHFKNREFKLSFSRLLRILSFPKTTIKTLK